MKATNVEVLGAWTEAEAREAQSVNPQAEQDPRALDAEMVRLPGDRSRFVALYAAAYKAMLMAELALERVQARTRLRFRDGLRPSGNSMVDIRGNKVTQDDFDAMVATDELVIRAGDDYAMARARREELGEILSGISTKREMLVNLGAQLRDDMERAPVTRSRRS